VLTTDYCWRSRTCRIAPLQITCWLIDWLNSGTVRDNEESLIKINRKSIMGFPTKDQSRSCVTPSLPIGSGIQILRFLHKFRPKSIKSLQHSFIDYCWRYWTAAPYNYRAEWLIWQLNVTASALYCLVIRGACTTGVKGQLPPLPLLYVEEGTGTKMLFTILQVWWYFTTLHASLTNWFPSVLWQCLFGHLACKIVPEMTYCVSSGTLSPYTTSTLHSLSVTVCYVNRECKHGHQCVRDTETPAWN